MHQTTPLGVHPDVKSESDLTPRWASLIAMLASSLSVVVIVSSYIRNGEVPNFSWGVCFVLFSVGELIETFPNFSKREGVFKYFRVVLAIATAIWGVFLILRS